MNRTQEQKLIRRAAAGDRGSAELLIQTHQRSVYAFVLRMSGRPDVAEDVVQEAFVRVLTHLDRFNTEYRFSTWLFTIARRVYLNKCEKKQPRSGADEAIQTVRVDSDGASVHEEEADEREYRTITRVRLEDALQKLTFEQREVVVLFHQHEWPLWLIAEQLEIPLGTVKSHLHRGRMRLRELMTAPIAVPAIAKVGENTSARVQTPVPAAGITRAGESRPAR
jgi:RNA polymerase sigma-70 factor (ECF subfamily)